MGLRQLWRVLWDVSPIDAPAATHPYAPLHDREPATDGGLTETVEPPAPVASDSTALAEERPCVSDEELAIMVSVMRVAPDIRYRAARSLGLLDGLERHSGVELERSVLERAYERGKLVALGDALVR